MRKLAVAVALAVGLAGCAAREGAETERQPVHIEVENRNAATVRIVILRNTTRTRLGLVTSMSVDTFQVPEHLRALAHFRLRAEPVGGFEYHTTEDFSFRPGDWIRYVINPQLATSGVAIY